MMSCCHCDAVAGLKSGAGAALRYYLFYSISVTYPALYFAVSMSAFVSIDAHLGLLWRVLSSEDYRGLVFLGLARHG